MPQRVCHIDGDYLAYYASGSADTQAGATRFIVKNKIETFTEMSGASRALVHLTMAGSTKAERFLIATVKGYQQQRTGSAKPKNWACVREYLETAPYVTWETSRWVDREADDALALAAYSARDPCITVVHATKDKDMRMLPGVHLSWSDYTLTSVPRGCYELVGPYDGLVYGTKWFWLQCLQGDGADNIPGLESYDGKNVGDVTAARMLAGTTCDGEAYDVVSHAYQSTYGFPLWADRFVEQAALLWLRTTTHAPLNDMLRVVPANPAILGALIRLEHRVRKDRATLNQHYAQAAALEDESTAGE